MFQKIQHHGAYQSTFHGGAFWNAIGENFGALEKSKTIINADVLDAWFDPSPKVIEKIHAFLPLAIKTSPPTHCEGLVQTIAEYRGIPKNHILVGGGSSDLMFAFFPNILKKNDAVLILDPMYGEYAHIFDHMLHVWLFRHNLLIENDFVIDENALHAAIKSIRPKMVVLVNPNSPTGKYCPRENIVQLAQSFPATIFVVDETYVDYVGKEESLEQHTESHRNIVVIKSMSKVYALSGARVGYLVAHPNVIRVVAPSIPPWSVSLIGQIAAVEALQDEAYYKAQWAKTHVLREQMITDLQASSVKIYGSIANFFLMQLKNHSAQQIIGDLKKQNIFLRHCDSMSTQFHDDFIRIAIKDKKINQAVVDALKKLL